MPDESVAAQFHPLFGGESDEGIRIGEMVTITLRMNSTELKSIFGDDEVEFAGEDVAIFIFTLERFHFDGGAEIEIAGRSPIA